MSKIPFWWLVAAAVLNGPVWAQGTPSAPAAVTARGQTVSLQAAISRALANSPQLKSAESAMLASEGERRQAGMPPNPEIGLEAENVAGRGPYKGTDAAEISFGVSQRIETGGKRAARRQAAGKSYEIAAYDYSAARLDLIRDVTIAYADAVAAQEEARLAGDQRKLAGDVLQSVASRVAAAAEPLIQKSKAEVALATSENAYSKALRELEIAKKKLASLWGQDGAGFVLDASDFFAVIPVAFEDGLARLAATPDIARLDAGIARAKANLDLEQANAMPDPTFSAGIRDFRETRDQALMFGISVPIPVWNANQGNIEKARHDASKSESDRQAALLSMSSGLTRAGQELQAAYDETESLKTTILPAAEKVFSLLSQGYQAGRFPYLEVLDAQRTLFEARSQYNAALKNYHISRAGVERLTAAHAGSTFQNEAPNE